MRLWSILSARLPLVQSFILMKTMKCGFAEWNWQQLDYTGTKVIISLYSAIFEDEKKNKSYDHVEERVT